MFSITLKGQTLVVIRSLELPYTEHLGGHTLRGQFKINCDLGIPPNSKAAGDVYEVYLKAFRKEIDQIGKKRASEYIKIWKETDKKIGPVAGDPKARIKLTKSMSDQFASKWESFSKIDAIKVSDKCLSIALGRVDDSAKAALKKRKKFGVISSSIFSDIAKMTVALIAAASTSGLSLLAFGLAGFAALYKGHSAAKRLAQSQATDVANNMADIQNHITTAEKAIKNMKPAVKLLIGNKKRLNLTIARMHLDLKKTGTTFAQATAISKQQGQKDLAKTFANSSRDLATGQAELEKLSGQVSDMRHLLKTIESLSDALEVARKAVEAEQSDWGVFADKLGKTTAMTSDVYDFANKAIKVFPK